MGRSIKYKYQLSLSKHISTITIKCEDDFGGSRWTESWSHIGKQISRENSE